MFGNKKGRIMEVPFLVGINVQVAQVKEAFTLEQLGIDKNLTGEEPQEAVAESYNEWAWEQLYGGFDFID